MSDPKRTVFISHFKEDINEVEDFIDEFKEIFIPKILGANDNDDYIDSSDTNYVMQRIRDLYLENSTVTIVLLGACTHSRRYIDWEIKSSLQQGADLPNGLLGIALPSTKNKVHFPERLKLNWKSDTEDCYARLKPYPTSGQLLLKWIEDAHQARHSRSHFIENPVDTMLKNNSKCKVCNVTHT